MWPNSRSVSRNQFAPNRIRRNGGIGRRFAFTLAKAVTIFAILGCSNSFSGFADKESDEALLYKAKAHIRDSEWDDAIDACRSIGSSKLTVEEYAITCASAFAGRCGFDVLGFITTLGGLNATTTVYELLINDLTNTTAQDVSDCDTAESILIETGTATERSLEVNGLVVLLGLYKVGVAMNELADPDENGLPDGYNSCAMADDDADMIATSFAEVADSLTVLSPTSTFWDTLNTAMTAVCGAVETVLGATYNICSYTSGAFTNDQRNGVRTMVREGAMFGMDECTGDQSVVTCNCP